jgi:hypothetical protein
LQGTHLIGVRRTPQCFRPRPDAVARPYSGRRRADARSYRLGSEFTGFSRESCAPVPTAAPPASGQLLSARPAVARNRLLRKGLRGDLGSAGPQRGRTSLSGRRILSEPGDLGDLVPRFRHMKNQALIGCSRRSGFECRLPGRSARATNFASRLAAAPVWWNCGLADGRGSCGGHQLTAPGPKAVLRRRFHGRPCRR